MKIKPGKLPPLDLENLNALLIGIWRRFHKLTGPSDLLQTREFRGVVAAVQALQEGLETTSQLVGKDYFSQPDLLGAYLLYYWAIRYQQGVCLINELPQPPRRVLDIGSGPAPFAFASLHHGARDVTAIDRNLTALKLGAEVCGRYGYPLTIRQHDCLKGPLPVEGQFDLIIVGHCLEELFPFTQKGEKEKQKAFINRLVSLLTPDGMLLIVEGSRPASNQRVLVLRDELVKEGFPVQAPCVWKGECPALKSNNLCYAQREFEKTYLIKEIQRAAQINLSSVKMSYLIVRSPQADWPILESDKPYYRVISPPIDTAHGKRYYLCGTDGKKNLGSHLTQYPVEARAFEYLKRGELISIEDGLEKAQHIDIIQDSKIKVEAAINKPIPEKK